MFGVFFRDKNIACLKRKTHKTQTKIHKISKSTGKNRRGQEMISSFLELFFGKKSTDI